MDIYVLSTPSGNPLGPIVVVLVASATSASISYFVAEVGNLVTGTSTYYSVPATNFATNIAYTVLKLSNPNNFFIRLYACGSPVDAVAQLTAYYIGLSADAVDGYNHLG